MMFDFIGENNSNELCDTRKDQISMQRLLILCSAACKTEIIFDVVDISFDNSPCFIGVIPFFGSSDRSGISAQILVAKTLVPLQDAVVWFMSIRRIKTGEGQDKAVSRKDTDCFKAEDKSVLSDLSVEELAALCVGYGPGTPFAAVGDRSGPSTIFDDKGNPLTTNSHPAGYPGYVSPAIEKKNIRSVFYKDGPAGIGGIAWPTEMLLACAFDRELWQEFGDAVGAECEEQQVDVWLAPAANLHRNPLCGRNFEYFSEDPYLAGVCACEITKGVQTGRNVIVCPKHFAVNEQETFRRGNTGKNVDAVDSILTERAARELYLKPFEMLVREAHIACIMTSFNKINGKFAAGNQDLCTHILREEWGFDGVVVTDWGDMDIVVDGADAVAAGNDVVMPGGPPVIRQILKGYQEGRVTRADMELAVSHLLAMVRKTRRTGSR